MPRTAQLLLSCLLLGSTAAFNSPFNRFNKRSVRRVNKFPGKGKGGGFFGGNNMGGGGNNKGPGPLDSSAADGGGVRHTFLYAYGRSCLLLTRPCHRLLLLCCVFPVGW